MDPLKFYNALIEEKIEMYAGVPDSLLKEICACITDLSGSKNHTICANEGAAIGMAAGHYMATGKIGMVYMQNSGFGNTVNPLTSLADPQVYSIPMLLLIGWRGEPGVKDEPQHVKQGEISEDLLNIMGIPYKVVDGKSDESISDMSAMVAKARAEHRPVALLIKKGAFEKYTGAKSTVSSVDENLMSREEAIGQVLEVIDERAIVVSTTGMPSREIFEYRELNNQGHEKDFLTVGSMGHCSQIAFSIARAKANRQVVCVDGDGALLMHMGSIAIIGQSDQENLIHVVLNNGKHDSVGGQPTVAKEIDILAIAKACGYVDVIQVSCLDGITKAIAKMSDASGPTLIEVLIKGGSRADLGRPTTTPIENKNAFMSYLND